VGGGVTPGVPLTPSTPPVGWLDGSVLGAVEGAVLGSVLGAVDGSVEGAVLGSVEGAVLGSVLGAVDGSVEGAVLGSVEGAVLGAVDGSVLGSLAGQSMMFDFFVWTAGLSTLLPKVRSLSGHGFSVYPRSDQLKSWLPSFSVFWSMPPWSAPFAS